MRRRELFPVCYFAGNGHQYVVLSAQGGSRAPLSSKPMEAVMRRHCRNRAFVVSVVAALFLASATTAEAVERTVHDIFVDGKLAPGVRLTNGKVVGRQIHTVSLGADAWAKPMFEIDGLNIDISKVEWPGE